MPNNTDLSSLAPGKTLSNASEYEQLFGTRYRGPGRPVDAEPVFPDPFGGTHPIVLDVAIRRAYSVVHERHKDELTEVFLKELRVLRRRGTEQVVVDSGKLRAWNKMVNATLGLDDTDSDVA